MKPWCGNAWAYVKAEARTTIADRGLLAVDMILATAIPILLQVAVWSALFAAGVETDLSLPEVVSYYIFVICLGRMNNGYDVVEQFSEVVHNGTLDPHLVRPLPYWLQRLSGFLGGSLVYAAVVAVALLLDAFLRGGNEGDSPVDTILFLVTVVVVLLVSQILTFFLAFTLALLVAWTTRPELSLSLLIFFQTALGGTLLPPAMWGEPLRWFMTHNPFAYMLAAPAGFMSTHDFSYAVASVAASLAYTLVFALLSWWLWYLMMRRFEGVGG